MGPLHAWRRIGRIGQSGIKHSQHNLSKVISPSDSQQGERKADHHCHVETPLAGHALACAIVCGCVRVPRKKGYRFALLPKLLTKRVVPLFCLVANTGLSYKESGGSNGRSPLSDPPETLTLCTILRIFGETRTWKSACAAMT